MKPRAHIEGAIEVMRPRRKLGKNEVERSEPETSADLSALAPPPETTAPEMSRMGLPGSSSVERELPRDSAERLSVLICGYTSSGDASERPREVESRLFILDRMRFFAEPARLRTFCAAASTIFFSRSRERSRVAARARSTAALLVMRASTVEERGSRRKAARRERGK